MKISLNWVKEYIPGLQIDDFEALKEKMISIGLDIESIECEKEKFDKFIVAEVAETMKHPNADKLTVCKVNTGKSILNVVCGAPNVAKGQKVCLALEGAIIPKGGFAIKKSKLRGEPSEGMICAADELGISEDHSGIMVLKDNAEIGQEFSEYIGADDYYIDIGITPNRGDLFSHIGIAREIASIFGLKIALPEININESCEKSEDYAKVDVKSAEYCKRFTGRVIKNVKVQESPEWLKKRLTSIGLRPVNNIVDITNYVMMETGQPLHAFDYDKISGKKIIVRTADEGDKFITLDSKEQTLNDKSLMICDAESYSGIAGIMGGKSSEIKDSTNNVFLEVAYFDPVSIRKNSKKLGITTDASQRFERGVDIDKVIYASNRASMLIQQTAGGEILKGIIDVYPEKFNRLNVGVRVTKANQILGYDFKDDDIIGLLEKIEIHFLRREKDFLIFEIPEFRRMDLQREVDLIEEIARVHGYEKFESKKSFNLDLTAHQDYDDAYNKIIKICKSYFSGRGFNEILTYSQQDTARISNYGRSITEIENPNSVEMNAMRVNLVHGMQNVIQNNINNSGKDISLRLFETGKVFNNEKHGFSEEPKLCIGLCGLKDFYSFESNISSFDVYDLKGELEMFFFKLNLENLLLFNYYNNNQGESIIDISLGKMPAGKLYCFYGNLLNGFDIEGNVFIAELDINAILKSLNEKAVYRNISRFPPAKRDLAVVVDKSIQYSSINDIVRDSGGSLLRSFKLFDIYSGEKLGKDKKSMTFTLEFSSDEKTLTDAEINKQISKILYALEKNVNATLRN